ncbi:MAG: TIGR01777 family oxidoreductase [Acidobacteria bacterium]|nr:TIGR01777 family oxidoreductase [Acidobacteriota bacterium]
MLLIHHSSFIAYGGRWTAEKKRRIRDSRVKSTKLLAETLAGLREKPKVLVSASAIGFYGNRGGELLHEESASGEEFLSEVCREWEKAALPASQAGIRVVHLRIGIVLAAEGGALAQMLTPFKLGIGGRMGSGAQYMSWVALDDVVGIIKHALNEEQVRGPVNTVAPAPVTNAEFTKAMGRVLSRPALLPMPAFALRLALGREMADSLLLGGARVEPARLKATGYQFAYPELEGALRHVLKE